MSVIKVNVTHACDRCGAITKESTSKMKSTDFTNLVKESPTEYWVEDKNGTIVYRHHVESSKTRCPRSC